MKVSKTFLCVLFLLAAAATAAAQQPKPTSPSVPGLDAVLASEKLEDGVYTNAVLGLRLRIPDGWSVSEDATKKQIIEAGKVALKSNNEAQRAEMEKSISNTAVLLTLMQSPPGLPIQSALIMMVEKLPAPRVNATPYVTQVRTLLLENSTLKYAVDQDVHDETINGQPFVALDVFIASENIRVNQKYACQMRKGFAFCLIETYGTEAQLAALKNVADGITFK